MRHPTLSSALLIGSSTMTACAAPGDALTLADSGKANAVILVADSASEAVRHAAADLASHLEQVTGATFERVRQPDPKRANIAVGPGAARSVTNTFKSDDLGREGLVVRVVGGKDLVLAGGEPRGTLYAVFDFLERDIGCRWWTSKASTIPRHPTLTVPAGLNRRVIPPLEYRYSFWTDAFDPDWAVRNKSNGPTRLDPARGRFMSHGGVHTFNRLVPPSTHFDKHPEWFSEVGGKRIRQHGQLCLTNEAMREELVKNLRERLRKQPEPPIYSVSQNDWAGYCTCAECQALAATYGGQSGAMVWFVNQVAETIENEFPEHTISTLAYQYTRKPPKGIRPRPNVVIQLCSIECSFAVPLTHERNARFRDDIVGWSNVADRLYIWDYVTNFRHHFMPHPNLRVLGPNVRFFAEHHAKGIFEQGAYTTLGAELAELRAWVLAKLLWDPGRDDKQLIREFCAGYYGPAAEHILAYIELTHDSAGKHGEYAHCLPSYEYSFGFLDFATLTKAWYHMQAAERTVRDAPELLPRVQLAQLPVLYAFMWHWDALRTRAGDAQWPIDTDIKAVAAHFKQVAKEHGVTRVNEWHAGFGLVDKAVGRAKE